MKQIAIDKPLFDQLMAVSKWYYAIPKNTPNFYAGDRFHESVFEFQHSVIPDDVLTFDSMYVSHFELQGEDLFAMIADETVPGEYAAHKIVSK